MEHTSYLGTIITFMTGGKQHYDQAKEVYPNAKIEFEEVQSKINVQVISKLKPVEEFLNCFNQKTEQRLGAATKVSGAKIAFELWIVKHWKEQQRREAGQSHRQDEISHQVKSKVDDKQKHEQNAEKGQSSYPPAKSQVSHQNDIQHQGSNFQIKTYDPHASVSEHASRSLRSNNPNIADLSDANRPTKTAERFSELYDNEWTDAFEELYKRLHNDKEVIDVLLQIAQLAYSDCIKESKRQINILADCAVQIVKYGKIIPSKEGENSNLKTDKNLLVQYRKEIASGALTRMKENFEAKNSKAFRHYGPMTKQFAYKCVELTWWMCVQDPPIYMDDDKDTRLHRPDFYKPYTQSGIKIDFIVWPALVLHEDGAVLAKGVAQYKKK